MLTDVIEPTSGRIELFGMDLKTHPIDIKKRIGVVPEDLALFEQLRAEEQLYLVGRIYGLDRDTVKTRADELMEVFDLKNARNRFVYELSTGMKKKLALMCALIHDPDLLFLDEPFQGIDAISSRLIQDNLCQLIHHGTTIFLTSHNLDLVQKLCTEVAIIHQGRIVLQGATKTIHDQLESTLQDADPDLESVFLKLVAPTYKPKLLSWIQTPG
jgi:ABC-2 type transport system ATP-binding protein